MYRLEEMLIRGRNALISHYMNAKKTLITHLLEKIKDKYRVTIIDPGEKITPYLPGKIMDTVLILTSSPKTGDFPADTIIYVEPPYPPRITAENILLTLTPGNYHYRIPNRYEKIWLNKIYEKIYELRFTSTGLKIRLAIKTGKVVVIDKPYGKLGEAYETLRNAMIEYGEIRTRDAVIILSSTLGVSREEARELLSRLILEKYVRIRKGYLNIY